MCSQSLFMNVVGRAGYLHRQDLGCEKAIRSPCRDMSFDQLLLITWGTLFKFLVHSFMYAITVIRVTNTNFNLFNFIHHLIQSQHIKLRTRLLRFNIIYEKLTPTNIIIFCNVYFLLLISTIASLKVNK